MLIQYPGMNEPGMVSDAIVKTIDIFPTLTDLAGLESPQELEGVSLRAQLEDPAAESEKPAFAHWNRGQATVRTNEWRLIVHVRKMKLKGMNCLISEKLKTVYGWIRMNT